MREYEEGMREREGGSESVRERRTEAVYYVSMYSGHIKIISQLKACSHCNTDPVKLHPHCTIDPD